MTIEKTTFQRYHNTDKKASCSHEIVRAIDTASDSPIVFFASDTSCNHRSDAQTSLHNLVPITDLYTSHIHCTLNCICKKNHDILYHGNDVSYAFEQYTFFN